MHLHLHGFPCNLACPSLISESWPSPSHKLGMPSSSIYQEKWCHVEGRLKDPKDTRVTRAEPSSRQVFFNPLPWSWMSHGLGWGGEGESLFERWLSMLQWHQWKWMAQPNSPTWGVPKGQLGKKIPRFSRRQHFKRDTSALILEGDVAWG